MEGALSCRRHGPKNWTSRHWARTLPLHSTAGSIWSPLLSALSTHPWSSQENENCDELEHSEHSGSTMGLRRILMQWINKHSVYTWTVVHRSKLNKPLCCDDTLLYKWWKNNPWEYNRCSCKLILKAETLLILLVLLRSFTTRILGFYFCVIGEIL